jgi:hypothetical protein
MSVVFSALVADVTDTPVWFLAGSTMALALAAWLALLSLLDARKSRYGELLVTLSSRWDDPDVYESLRLYRYYKPAGTIALLNDLWGKDVTEVDLKKLVQWHRLSVWPNLIEVIGVFRTQRVLGDRIIYEMWGATIIEAWDEWQAPTEHLREMIGDPALWLNFERVAKAMRKTRETDDQRVGRFWIDSPGCMPPESGG